MAAGEWRLSVVLPAFDEEANIRRAVEMATATAARLCANHEIIVVDDGSTDGTAAIVTEIARTDPRVRLVQHGANRGYGEALRTGFTSARHDFVFFTDADNQFDLDELEHFLGWIDRVDVVAGYRLERCDPWFRRVNALGWNVLVRALFYVPVRDIDCAFKLFRRSVLQELDLQSVGAMVNTELMVKLGRSGYRVIELGVHHYPRRAGTARGASPRVILRALYELVAMYGRLSRHGVSRVPPDRDPEAVR